MSEPRFPLKHDPACLACKRLIAHTRHVFPEASHNVTSERTLEQALAHAESLQNFCRNNPDRDLSDSLSNSDKFDHADLVLLADEVKRLRSIMPRGLAHAIGTESPRCSSCGGSVLPMGFHYAACDSANPET